jgi:hypothetical protein
MRYEDIKNYFEEGIEGINKLMIAIKDTIDTIEDYQSQFKGNQLTEEADLKVALNVLTGLHSEVTIISLIADAYSEVNEARELLNAKNNLVDDGKGGRKSPTDEVAKAMSKVNNLDYLRTANLFAAYSKVCGQKIMTVQSQLNYLKKPIPPQG